MKYVIIGGDAAGMSAAMQVMKYDEKADITILERGTIYSYAQCGMPYVVSDLISSTDKLVIRDVETFRQRYGMDARIYHHVKKVDTDRKIVLGKNLSTGEKFQESYDKLLIASGANPFVPEWNGLSLNGIHTLKTIPDTNAIKTDLTDDVKNVTIVGGGYVGLEMAESFTLVGKHVRMLIRGDRLAAMFDDDMAEIIYKEADKHGIEILLNEEIEEVLGNETVKAVRTNNGKHETDLILIATGIRPSTEFLKGTDVDMADNGAVCVNEFLETNVKDVYAAGDCALQYNLVKQQDDYIPLGTNANKQGRIAGMNMAGKERSFKGTTGTSILRFMNLGLGKTGMSDHDAASAGLPYESVMIRSKHIASYYPDAKNILVKLTFRKDNGLLLGGQVIGEEGADKRVDVLTTALFNGMTVADLEDLDLSYAPPFNSTWDPIQQAARKAASKLNS